MHGIASKPVSPEQGAVHAVHTRLLVSLQAVVSYLPVVQVVHKLHPEVMAPSESQIFALEPASFRVLLSKISENAASRGTETSVGRVKGRLKGIYDELRHKEMSAIKSSR